ncbi:p21-activated protein kinase-interacting protein 1-like isoform X2 [Varroa destructor]|nr:p21-activated protein kinase-interacting protein 1-like isoform X2 [Varroa destructor]
MASGSSDETIQLYNMASRKEMGSLVKHDGTINALRFHGQTHLFSASDDGTICVWDTGSWQCLRTLKGHKQAVNDIAVHSSGKLLLSVSRDKSLYTWNLVKGRPAFITNIKVEASRVEWCPTDGPGDLFLVIHANQCDIYSTAAGGIVGSIDFGKKISDLAFIGRHLVLSGEEGKVNIFDLSVRDDLGRVAPSCLVDFNADPSGARIKCVAYAGPSELMGCHYLVTATSEGVITVWRVNIASESSDDKNKVRQLTNTTAGCRVTACDIYIKATESDGPSAGDDRKAAAKQETVLKKTTATKKRPSKSENYQKKIDERRQQQFIVEPKKIRTLDIKQVRKPGTVKGKKT